ncbi:MAG: PAS domain S-box protein [Clostridiales bacterium]|nr:PAS domain S-box protein [Clostridiales bacterium]
MNESELRYAYLVRNLASIGSAIQAAELKNQQHDQEEYNASILESERLLKAILDTTQDGVIIVYGDGNVIYANEAYYKMTGYSEEDLETLNINNVSQSNEREREKRLAAIKKKGAILFETVGKRKDGSIYDVEISVTCFSTDPMINICFIRDITDRKNAEKAILHSHDLMRYIIEHNRSAVAIHDKDLNYMYISRPYAEIFNVNPVEIIGKHHYEVFPELPQSNRDVHQRVLKGEVVSAENFYTESDGTERWMLWECRPWYENSGEIGGIILYSEVITEQKQLKQQLFNEKEQFKTILLSVGDGVISADNQGSITVMNPIAEKLTGWMSADALGMPLYDVLRVIREDTGKPDERYLERVIAAGSIIDLSNGLLLLSRDGRETPVEIGAAPIKDSKGNIVGVVIVIRDYTEKRFKQKEIEYLSYNDPLTGLYNRRYMEDSIKRLNTARNIPLTLMVIDVNGLKLTNDAFGHEAGDRLLAKVAGIFRKVCRTDDIIGRMGGDEFCILLPNTNEQQADSIKERIQSAASNLKLDPIILSLAVGYATKTSPEQDIKAIMTAADNLMYKDKIKYGKVMKSQAIDTVLHHINANYEQEHIHTEKVSQYCEAIAEAMGLSKKEITDIKNAAALHDIGKIMVPPQILSKPDKLTQEEYAIIKRHPEIGYQMLKSVDEHVMLAEYVLHHHECWDGTGYPEGLAGENIPLYSRMIAVADAYEAMTAVRPYQKTRTKEEAVAELIRCAGSQFDPEIVTIFIEMVLT